MRGFKTSVVLTLVISCAMTMVALVSSAHAAAIYWDSAYSGGMWTNTGGTGWNTSGTGTVYNQAWGYGGNYDANFTGTAGTVTVLGGISSVNSITFNTEGYTVRLGFITLTATGGPITTGSGADTISSSISGSVGLTKMGSGPLILSGSNSYSGGTIISAGTLSLGSTGAIGSTGTITFAGGTLQFSGSNANDYSNHFSTSPGQAYNIDTNSQSVTLATALTSSGGTLTKFGSGTLTLTGTNTYTGATTFTGGTVSVNTIGNGNVASNLGMASSAASNLVFNGGVLEYTGATASTDRAFTINSATTGTIQVDGTANLTITSSNSTATGALIKTGSGTLTLSGANTFAGGITIGAGTLALGSSGAIGNSGTITFGGGKLETNYATDLSSRFSPAPGQIYNFDVRECSMNFATALTSSGGCLNKYGWETLTLSATNTYSGPTTVFDGELDLNTTGGNAIAGDLIVSGGTAKFLQNNQIAGIHNLVVSGGTLSLGTYSQSFSGVQLTGGSIVGAVGILSSATDYDLQAGTVSANLGGAVALNKTSTGTVTLSGTNTYTGGTIITAGTLSLGSSGAIGSSGTITFGGGILTLYDTIDYSSRFSTAAGQAYNIDTNGKSVTLAAALASIGGVFNKYGDGTLILSGINTYTGSTNVIGGTLAAPLTSALPGYATGGKISVASIATLAINVGGTSEWTSADIDALLANATFLNGSVLSIDTTNASAGFVYANSINGTIGLTKLGSNCLTLSGANSYSGQTTVWAGELDLNAISGNSISGDITINGGTVKLLHDGQIASGKNLVVRGGTLDLQGYNLSAASVQLSSGSIIGAGSTLTAAHNYDVRSGAVSVNIGGSVALNKTTNDTLILSGENTYTGGTVISGGILSLGSPGAIGSSGTITFGIGGTLQFSASNTFDFSSRFSTAANQPYSIDTNGQSVTFATALTSSGGTLTKFGSGTLTLSAVNTYTGVTNVLGGELDLNAVGGNAIAGNLTFLDYGTVKLLQSNQIASGKTLYLSTGNGTFDLQGFNQTLANVQLGSGSIVSSGGIMTSTAAFNMQNGFVSAVLCGSAGLNKNLGGTVTLSGANIYTGPTTITAGKLLLSGGDNRLPTTTSVVLTNTNGAILDLNGQNQTIASLSGGGANGGNVTLGGGTLTLDSTLNGSPDSIYSGVISGTCGKLTKLGPNMLTLSGANTYNGTTTISSGTLALAGKGQISATSQIVNNATFLIVDNIASHTLGAITGTGTTQLNDGAQLTATSVVQDILTIGSGATFTIQPIPGGPMALSENLTSVPEASTLILLGIGVVGLLGYIWRQRKHRA